jgi:nucleoside-diphosphate-sugar epimerase
MRSTGTWPASPPNDARLFPIRADLRGPVLLDALAGVDAVIHLAAQNPYPDASWEDASASFDMTAKLVDTCAKASVSRLVFASSNHVMGGYKDTPVALSDGGPFHRPAAARWNASQNFRRADRFHDLRGGKTDGRARRSRQSGGRGLLPKLSKRDSEGGFPNRRVSDSRWRAQEVRHAHSTSG